MPSVKAKEYRNKALAAHKKATEIVERAEREDNRDLTRDEENAFNAAYRSYDRYSKLEETEENNAVRSRQADALAEQQLMDRHATKSSGKNPDGNTVVRAKDMDLLDEIGKHPEDVSRAVSREFPLENFYPMDPAYRVYDGSRSASLYDFEPSYDPITHAQRTISTGIGPSGVTATSELDHGVPTWVQTLIEHLVQEGMLTRYASRIQTAHGNKLVWPKTSAYSSASIIGEGKTISASEPTFAAPLELEAWKYAFIILVTPEALADVRFALGNFLMRQGRAALARAFNTHIVTGNGSSKPSGIVSRATTGVTGGDTTNYIPTYDEMVSLVHSVIPPYRNRGAAFLMSDNTLSSIRKIKNNSTDNLPIFQPSYFAGQPDRILGWPIVVDYNVPDAGATGRKAIVFGDLSAYIMRFAGGIRIGRSIHDQWPTDQISIRFIFRGDGDLSDNNAVKLWVAG